MCVNKSGLYNTKYEEEKNERLAIIESRLAEYRLTGARTICIYPIFHRILSELTLITMTRSKIQNDFRVEM